MIKNEQKRKREPVVMSMVNDQCVWGRAGVIKPIKCINAFDCLGCTMDQRVLANFEEKRSAESKKDKRPSRMVLLMNQGKCRHMLSGRISYGLCSYGYNCVKCPFDQMIEDTSYLPNLKPPVVDATSGFNVARDHYCQNRPNAVLKRNGNEAPTLSPVDGIVVAVNHQLLSKTTIANKDPYGEGWLMVIQPSSLRNNLKNLFFGAESLAWVDDEFFKLQKLMGEVYGEDIQYKMAATGGEAISDIYGEVPELGWDRLVGDFLHSK